MPPRRSDPPAVWQERDAVSLRPRARGGRMPRKGSGQEDNASRERNAQNGASGVFHCRKGYNEERFPARGL